jgi:hypothetical protein
MTPRQYPSIAKLANIAEYAVTFGISFSRAYYLAISPSNYRIMRRQIGALS